MVRCHHQTARVQIFGKLIPLLSQLSATYPPSSSGFPRSKLRSSDLELFFSLNDDIYGPRSITLLICVVVSVPLEDASVTTATHDTPTVCTTDPDRRHLEKIHARLDGGGGTTTIIDPCSNRQKPSQHAAISVSSPPSLSREIAHPLKSTELPKESTCPEHEDRQATPIAISPTCGHAIVSQKKTKKPSRGQKQIVKGTVVKHDSSYTHSIDENIQTENPNVSDEDTMVKTMSNNGHDKWRNFVHYFAVDQPTAPVLESSHNAEYGTLCAFAKGDIKDCPFHHPCRWNSNKHERRVSCIF
jgi:hypothetical protein